MGSLRSKVIGKASSSTIEGGNPFDEQLFVDLVKLIVHSYILSKNDMIKCGIMGNRPTPLTFQDSLYISEYLSI